MTRPRLIILAAFPVAILVVTSGCVSTKVIEKHAQILPNLPAPVSVYRPVRAVLSDFQKMVIAAQPDTSTRARGNSRTP
jgi:hypothetical protein